MSSLETSVTLEDVFAVVNAKRVPLAPELAGYLALEIAEGADAAGGDVDPKFVFIGEEGTVGLVRPRRDGATGDAELSIRSILARLLEASGSQTPALSLASKRRGTAGLPSLVEELEAALIPVNRAAGRRALARLAREVKRVTLGVGRNASVPPSERAPRGSSPSHVAIPPAADAADTAPAAPRPPLASSSFAAEEDRTSARGNIPTEVRTGSVAPPPEKKSLPPPIEAYALTPSIPIVHEAVHEASELPTVQFEPTGASPSRPARVGSDRAPGPDSVDSLIASFGVSRPSDLAVGRELKAMIGLEPTPPPPNQKTEQREADVDALLALSGEQTGPQPQQRAPSSHPFPEAPAPLQRRRAPAPAALPEPISASEPAAPVPEARPSDRQLPTGPSKLRPASLTNEAGRGHRAKGSNAGLLILVALIALGLGAVAIWRLKPGIFSGAKKEKTDGDTTAEAPPVQRPCRSTLVVTDVPKDAEVLLRVGQAPVDVDKMPVGKRLEFVATAEGYASKRTVVPAGQSWGDGKEGPRIEQAVQLDKLKPNAPDLWPGGEPGSSVGGVGPPGTVHLVSTPKGAEMWLLAGVGPEARIELPQCDVDVEVLVAAATSLRKRMTVAKESFLRQESEPKGTGPTIRSAAVSAGGKK